MSHNMSFHLCVWHIAEGVMAQMRRCETEAHGLTGDIVIGKDGMPGATHTITLQYAL